MTTDAIELRVISPSAVDLPSTVEVLNAAFRRHTFLGRERTSLEEILEELHPNSRFLQLFEAGALVGTAVVTPGQSSSAQERTYPGIDFARALHFGMAGVRPERMGLGLGGRLVREAERLARHDGYKRIILTTVEEMGNVAYYQRFGFRSVSVRELPAGYWGLTIPTREHGMVKDLPAIREARADEAESIAAIINRAYEVESFFKIGDRTDADEIRELLAHETFLVLEHAPGLLGAVRVSAQDGEGHFAMLSVEPTYKGKGFGRVLVEAAEGWASGRGCRVMTLEVVNLRTELFPWYRKLGYEVYAEEPWPPDSLERISQPAHFVFMRKDLPARAGGEKR